MGSDPTRGRSGRVRRTYMILIPTLIVLWFLSGIDHKKHPGSDPNWPEIFWVSFGIVFVSSVIFSAVVLVRAVSVGRRRRNSDVRSTS